MICPKCGTENGDSSLKCVKCWRPLQPVEKGPWLGSKPGKPGQIIPSRKSPSVSVRRIITILTIILVIVALFSVFIPDLVEIILEKQIKSLEEKAKQDVVRPAPALKTERAKPAVQNRGERKDTPVVIPSLNAKVTRLLFFKSGHQPTDRDKRIYAGQFQGAQSRYINWELRLVHPRRERRSDFQIDEIWYKPDGSILAKQSLKTRLEATWVCSFHHHSWGWKKPSHWLPGKYRVELSIGGSRIAVGHFTVN